MEFTYENSRIYSLGDTGDILAEITFPLVAPGIADVDRTFVDPSLRGKGVAGTLMEAAVAQLRDRGLKTRASCPYAAKWFAAHPEQGDLLAE